MSGTRLREALYKATRPDGTDHFTGTVDYAAALLDEARLRRAIHKANLDRHYGCSHDVVPYLATGEQRTECEVEAAAIATAYREDKS